MLALLPLLLLTMGCKAQVDYSNDSLRVVDAEWSIDTLEGFYLKRYQFGEGALFCSAQHLCIIEIPARSHRRLAFTCDTGTVTIGAVEGGACPTTGSGIVITAEVTGMVSGP